VASTKRFTTGGGFPHEGSPGRPIEFTLSYGRSGLLPNPDEYTHRLEFSNPEDSAYVCGMYGPPRDNVGLQQATRLPGLVSGKPIDHLLPPSIFGLPEAPAPGDEDWLLQLLAPRRGR